MRCGGWWRRGGCTAIAPDAPGKGTGRARYELYAGGYERVTRLASLGGIARLYRATAEALELEPGTRVLDLGCGPATLTPYLLERIGPTGSVIGVDVARGMIERARSKAEARGWTNARFECADALGYQPPSRVGAVALCLSLSTMPEPLRCLKRALGFLEPGGRIAVLDSFPDPSRRLASFTIRLKSPLVGARPSREPLERLAAELGELRTQHFFLGVYSLVSGRKPA